MIETGGGSGIGKGACQRISEEGALVVVADKRLDLAEAVASGL
ncbi:MAG: SDR family NAD(P)-dependent oxidoreductase [Myxococcota bacterium]|nr:SDR family NAD(P)-dependent oxidoreductase [Myxococcota bacterium]